MTIFEYAKESFSDAYDITLKGTSELIFNKLAEKFGVYEVKSAIDIACEQYEDEVTALFKLHGILTNRAKVKSTFIEEDKNGTA